MSLYVPLSTCNGEMDWMHNELGNVCLQDCGWEIAKLVQSHGYDTNIVPAQCQLLSSTNEPWVRNERKHGERADDVDPSEYRNVRVFGKDKRACPEDVLFLESYPCNARGEIMPCSAPGWAHDPRCLIDDDVTHSYAPEYEYTRWSPLATVDTFARACVVCALLCPDVLLPSYHASAVHAFTQIAFLAPIHFIHFVIALHGMAV